MRKTFVTALVLVLLSVLPLKAENGINSPYSRYGFGQLATYELGVNKAMGGTGIALRNQNQLNLLNPASYSSVDTLTFIMDMGVSLQNTNFAENGIRKNARNSSFDHLAIQYRLRKGLGMTIGFMPYSNVGYNYSQTQKVYFNDDPLYRDDDAVTITNKYVGEGGLHSVIAGLGWAPFKWISVGADATYIYGNFDHYIYNQYSESTINKRTKQYTTELSGVSFDFGGQLQFEKAKHKVTLGATYALGTTFNNDVLMVDYVVNSGTSALSSDTVRLAPFAIPQSFGAGLAYNYDNRLTVTADMSMTQYGAVQFFGEPGMDRYRAALGFEYIPELITRKFFRRMRYRAGIFAASPSYTMGGGVSGPYEYGASVGVGIPIINGWNNRSIVNVSGQFIHLQPSAPNMITENYIRLNVSVSFIENWFSKWRVN
ncbi:MAG: hypothetical protein J5814_06205 [Bacteroidaceae bacterium]|nr:hypothetical protein [Bacteroidaceae bacterium]